MCNKNDGVYKGNLHKQSDGYFLRCPLGGMFQSFFEYKLNMDLENQKKMITVDNGKEIQINGKMNQDCIVVDDFVLCSLEG